METQRRSCVNGQACYLGCYVSSVHIRCMFRLPSIVQARRCQLASDQTLRLPHLASHYRRQSLSLAVDLFVASRRCHTPALHSTTPGRVSVQHHQFANASSHRLTEGPLPSGLDTRQPQMPAPALQPQAACACLLDDQLVTVRILWGLAPPPWGLAACTLTMCRHRNSMFLAIRLHFCWPDQMAQK